MKVKRKNDRSLSSTTHFASLQKKKSAEQWREANQGEGNVSQKRWHKHLSNICARFI